MLTAAYCTNVKAEEIKPSAEGEHWAQSYYNFAAQYLVAPLSENEKVGSIIPGKMDSESFEQYTPTFVFGNILQRAVERGELRDDLPLEYMAFLVLSHLLTYMMTITVEDSQRLESAKIKHFVRQGILNELCKKNV